MRRGTVYGIAAGAGAAIVGAVVTAAVLGASVVPVATKATGDIAVDAGISGCGTGWTGSSAGALTFDVKNTSIAGMEVYLQRAGASAQPVYLDLESIGTGATVRGQVTLAAGRYRFVCLPADEDPIDGPVVTVSGAKHVLDATPGIVPVTQNNLIPAAKQYGTWIESRLPVLQGEASALQADVASGDLAKARTEWLTAHLEYESLGAAYGAFGDADTAINGMPASGRTALDDPDLTGFHKIEALLWSGATPATIVPFTKRLVADIGTLRTTFPTARIDPLDIGLRAHEILENALQFELTGATDAGSHTNLATLDANLAGTVQALQPLRGILKTRYPDLAKTDAAIAASRTLVESYRGANGSWTPVQNLSTAQRERLDAQIDQTVELLAPVAAICDVRRAAS
ncbi:EfeM/EfeO family lipoprotein [Humibacter ginsenosidimutans]|uniref:EfeM/EfeO family lipoprotein n=1 Tax=Humibacter ginsenosidimutans TaxID=2599293 RepID=A0A5B8M7N8_9MICO|nr:EfeM/EfeO family lipoprotein [Humibacter ginsenosidimutans]QDZ16024.1 EfeM/EfeO family lipoprotein [Humibacter ginsenosidimutans]